MAEEENSPKNHFTMVGIQTHNLSLLSRALDLLEHCALSCVWISSPCGKKSLTVLEQFSESLFTGFIAIRKLRLEYTTSVLGSRYLVPDPLLQKMDHLRSRFDDLPRPYLVLHLVQVYLKTNSN